MNQQMKEFVLELNTPFEELDCREAFENLTVAEQKYLHFYSKVSYCSTLQVVVFKNVFLFFP